MPLAVIASSRAVSAGVACLLLVPSLSGATALAQGKVQSVYVVLPVTTAIGRTDKIGSKKAGLLCLPNGALNGEDLRAELAPGAQAIADAMKAGGFFAVTSEEFLPIFSDTARYKTRWVKVAIQSASFNMCARKWGLGNKLTYSGTATLRLDWALRNVADAASGTAWVDEVTVEAGSSDARSIGQFVAAGLAKSFDAAKIPR